MGKHERSFIRKTVPWGFSPSKGLTSPALRKAREKRKTYVRQRTKRTILLQSSCTAFDFGLQRSILKLLALKTILLMHTRQCEQGLRYEHLVALCWLGRMRIPLLQNACYLRFKHDSSAPSLDLAIMRGQNAFYDDFSMSGCTNACHTFAWLYKYTVCTASVKQTNTTVLPMIHPFAVHGLKAIRSETVCLPSPLKLPLS